MAIGYYSRFDVYSIDAEGRRVPAAGIVLNVTNITTATAIGTVTADEYGVVEQGSYDTPDGEAGEVIEFNHATIDRAAFRRRVTLTASYDDAYQMTDISTRFAMELSNAGRRQRSTTAMIYAQDLDEPTAAPIMLGIAKAGETAKFPIQTAMPKRYRLYPVSDIHSGQGIADGRFREDLAKDIVITPTASNLLWSDGTVFRDSTGVLYANVLPGEALLNNGDVVKIVYQGFYDLDAGNRNIRWFYDETVAFDRTENLPGIQWRLEIDIVREAEDSIALLAVYLNGDSIVDFQQNVIAVPAASDVVSLRLEAGMSVTCGVQMRSNYARRLTIVNSDQIAYLVDDDGAFIIDDDGTYVLDHGA